MFLAFAGLGVHSEELPFIMSFLSPIHIHVKALFNSHDIITYMLALLFLIFILYLITGSIEAAMALFVGGALIYAGINILNDSSRRANIRGLNCFDLQSVNEFNSFRESCNRFAGVYVLINKTNGLH